MKTQKFVLRSLLSLVMLMLLAGLWLGPAAAAPPEQRDYRGLEYRLQWGLLRVEAFQDRIDHTRAGTDLAETIIEDEAGLGNDTSALEAALAEWRTGIDEAQSLRDSAAQTLDEKAGFDAGGNVVDPEQARETLKTAHQTLQEARQTIRSATQEFRQAMREYRQNQRPSRQ